MERKRKFIKNEFTIKNYVYGKFKGKLVPVIDITFTPIYKLFYNGNEWYFKTFQLREKSIKFLKEGIIAPNSTFEYIEGYKVLTNLIK